MMPATPESFPYFLPWCLLAWNTGPCVGYCRSARAHGSGAGDEQLSVVMLFFRKRSKDHGESFRKALISQGPCTLSPIAYRASAMNCRMGYVYGSDCSIDFASIRCWLTMVRIWVR